MTDRPICAFVLAAGAGTRMRSSRPKPLHMLVGRPMVLHVLDSLSEVEVTAVVMVVGHGAERVIKAMNEEAPSRLPLHFVEQATQRGTGDAVSLALTALPDDPTGEFDEADVLILPGDIPLLEPETVTQLIEHHRYTDSAGTLLTVELDEPTGYGRIVRDKQGRVRRIVEQADASEDERAIREVNTSVYCVRANLLGPALRRVTDANAQGEYYLTDVIEVLAEAGYRIETMVAEDAAPAVGVNDRAQLAAAEAEMRRRINEHWMRAGVTMLDPATTYIDQSVRLAEDVVLYPGTQLRGATIIGRGAEIGPDSTLEDCAVGDNAIVARSDARLGTIGAGARVGPYTVLPPGFELAERASVGPFFVAESGTEDE